MCLSRPTSFDSSSIAAPSRKKVRFPADLCRGSDRAFRGGGMRKVGVMYSVVLMGLNVLIGSISTVGAQAVEAASSEVHVVRSGDTLWELAGRYLTDPFLWPEIYSANRGVVQDPHWIFPQERLLIPRTIATSTAPAEAVPPPEPVGRVSQTAFTPPAAANEVLTPVLRQAVAGPVPVVPPGAFHGAGLLTPPEELAQLGSIVDLVGASVIELGSSPQIQPYDQVYVSLTGGVTAGDRVQFLRPDRVVPPYGRVFIATGGGLILSVSDGVAIVEVSSFYDRVDIGDLMVRPGVYPVVAGETPQPAIGLAGSILALQLPQPIPATGDLVFLDLGEASSVKVGDEFEVFLAPEEVEWGTRPEVFVGRLQVVRTTRLTSTARVTKLEQPALQTGLPVRLTARMP
jgi:hypothetical protein